MKTSADVLEYNADQTAEHEAICTALAKLFSKSLPDAESKVWHGHPVWFIESNPVVGYSVKKAGVQVLFWSGQSFGDDSLKAIGSFKAAGLAIESVDAFDARAFAEQLQKCRTIQWDYASLPKKKALEKLTDF